MAEELEHTEILNNDFVNNFSHEFKTPIASIAGFAKLLKYGELSEEDKKELIKNDIEPVITLYHWDLPQKLDDMGGFLNKDFYLWFLEYTKTVVNFLGNRAKIFITFNEPINAINSSYFSGVFAPGKKLKEEEIFQCICNMHKAHNFSAKYIREKINDSKVSIAISTFEEYPVDDTKICYEVVRKRFFTRELVGESLDAYLDPIYLGVYPDYCYEKFPEIMKNIDLKELREMSKYTNAISYNNYSGYPIDRKGKNVKYEAPFYSALGQPYNPKGFEYGIRYLTERYQGIPLYITENGIGLNDSISEDGKIHDKNRCQLLLEINEVLLKLISDGIDIRGYFVWSIMDNFEWTSGYKYRFGLVYVDYRTLKRIKKDSFLTYKTIISKRV